MTSFFSRKLQNKYRLLKNERLAKLMPSRYLVVMRPYQQEDCPIAQTLDVIGERWTILVLRDLFLQGPRRFQDLQESLAGVAPNTLSARLKTMDAHGLIASRLYSEHPPRLEYYLSEKGKSLGPVLEALREWGRCCLTGSGSTVTQRRGIGRPPRQTPLETENASHARHPGRA
jgi:DNA-binding HxlR family transcriptional regulator